MNSWSYARLTSSRWMWIHRLTMLLLTACATNKITRRCYLRNNLTMLLCFRKRFDKVPVKNDFFWLKNVIIDPSSSTRLHQNPTFLRRWPAIVTICHHSLCYYLFVWRIYMLASNNNLHHYAYMMNASRDASPMKSFAGNMMTHKFTHTLPFLPS